MREVCLLRNAMAQVANETLKDDNWYDERAGLRDSLPIITGRHKKPDTVDVF